MVLSQLAEKITIFFSLSPATRDRHLFEQLRKHLSALKRPGLIDLWYDSEINPGNHVKESIQSYIRTADIIVLLISADFLDTDRCVEMEMPYALEQATTRAAHVIPVLLRPTMWSGFPLEQYSLLPRNGRPISTWGDLDTALTEVAKGIRQVVEDLARRWSNTPRPARAAQSPLSTLPHRRNPFFTDRDEIMAELYRLFTSEQTPQTSIQALHGMGGIGKTLLAVEYACRHHHEYQAIFWLKATSPELLSAGIISLAEQLNVPARDDLNERQRIAAIKEWLQHHDRWLIVLDDLEDFSILDQLIPAYSSGHVLLTTQSQATGQLANAIFVDQMTVAEGALLLLRRAKIILAQDTDSAASEVDVIQARKIAQEFTGHPLALDQAGAYIEENRRMLASYFTLYQQQKTALLGRRGRLASDHPDPVTTTFALTFEKIARIDPLALELLRFCAFLHPETIPDEMITHGASSLEGPLRTLALDPLAFDETLTTLQRFSLIQRRADSTTLNMQRILQIVIQKDLTKKQQLQLAKQAVRLVNFIFPEIAFTNWNECERYIPQAQHCASLIRDLHLTLQEGGLLLERLGFYCFQRGRYSEAETYLKQALHLYEHHRRTDLLHHAQTLNSLGLLYHQRARYAEAETLHQHALELRERILGPDNTTTVESLHNLAMIYGEQGKYQQAEHLYLRVLAVEETAKGPDHPAVADTLNELGLTYAQQGRFTEAETAYQRVLEIYTHTRDARHPDLTYPLDGLGALAEQRGNYQQAASLYQQALTICEQAFGEMHPETAHSINRLAGIAALQNDNQQAENLYALALRIYEQTLGPLHPDVALILNEQALLASRQKEYQKAEQLYQQALKIYEMVLGSEHPAVASVLNNLGQLARMTGNKEHAEELLQRALTIRTKVLDPTHASIAQSLGNLADLLSDQQRYAEAEPLFQRALALYLLIPDPKHQDIAQIPEKYASLLEHLNKNAEAATLQHMIKQHKEELSSDPSQDDN